jgi:hypothetical protein
MEIYGKDMKPPWKIQCERRATGAGMMPLKAVLSLSKAIFAGIGGPHR